MIFVTVGSDVPFDRMIRVVDRWARGNDRRDVFAQIGRGGWRPGFVPHSELLDPPEFRERLSTSRIVIGHAGMGTILSALQYSKPILVMPRKGSLGETRNDHQIDTVRQLLELGRVNVAFDEEELFQCLNRIDDLAPRETIPPFADDGLISGLRTFIHGMPDTGTSS
jgi:UDP-N-acetylglucosamine transferase subunit ALG13